MIWEHRPLSADNCEPEHWRGFHDARLCVAVCRVDRVLAKVFGHPDDWLVEVVPPFGSQIRILPGSLSTDEVRAQAEAVLIDVARGDALLN